MSTMEFLSVKESFFILNFSHSFPNFVVNRISCLVEILQVLLNLGIG